MVDTPDHPTLGRVGGGLEPWEFLARDERRPGRDTITKGKGRANMSNGVDGEEACDNVTYGPGRQTTTCPASTKALPRNTCI